MVAGPIERSSSNRSQQSPTNTSFGISDKRLSVIPTEADPKRRTLDDVRLQAANEVAVRAITHSEVVEGVRLGVLLTIPQNEEDEYLEEVADLITLQFEQGSFLFAVGTSGSTASKDPGPPLVFVSSSKEFISRVSVLTSAKFIGRLKSVYIKDKRWHVHISELGDLLSDEDALWHILRKATTPELDPQIPPSGSRGIEEILENARAKLIRITPEQARKELTVDAPKAPVFLVDIRPIAQRLRDGEIPGALIIERNVLEWRLDPRCYAHLPIADGYDIRPIVFCDEGYTSSLAAFSLHELGLANATDIIGGIQAWKAAGLPITPISPPK